MVLHEERWRNQGKLGNAVFLTKDHSNGTTHRMACHVDCFISRRKVSVGIFGRGQPHGIIRLQEIRSGGSMAWISYCDNVETRLIKVHSRPEQFPWIT